MIIHQIMKPIQFITTILATSVLMISCVQDDTFDVPNSVASGNSAKLNALMTAIDNGSKSLISIADLKLLYVSAPVEIESDLVVKGYVSSSDLSGNFYKEFYMQDAPENPTSGIKISLNVLDSYNFVNLGREVYIDLNGLFVGESNFGDGIVAIGGGNDGNELVQITENVAMDVVIRSTTTETMIPKVVSMSDINASHIGQLISFENAQFPIVLAGQFYVDPAEDYDTQHPIESCGDTGSFIVETSAFANFSQDQLPTDGAGTITGVITMDYFGDNRVMVLNDPSDFVMNAQRCDPLFADNFSSSNLNNWTIYNVAGAEGWLTTNFGNPGPSAVMNGYAGGPQPNEDWLISRAIDMSEVTSGTLTFQTVKRYNGTDLELYMCTDYNGGDPTTDGSWVQLSADFDTNTSSWSSWTDSGNVDVSAAAGGNLFFAFKYVSTSSAAATYEVDNVLVQ